MSDNTSTGSALISKEDLSYSTFNLSLASSEDLKYYRLTKLQFFTDKNAFDDVLYSLSHYNFASCKSSNFEHCGLRLAQNLRKLLCQDGVYIMRPKLDEIFNGLANVLNYDFEQWKELKILNTLR